MTVGRFQRRCFTNENWLLRPVLSIASRAVPCLPLRFAPGARWFSEARLYSRFLARRRGDTKTETHTHADGVVGHFSFVTDTKTGLLLSQTGSQFEVLEAKIFSKLRKGTKNADQFDQAVRTLACMAESLRRSGKPLEQWQSLGFHIVAPQSQIERGLFTDAMSKEYVLKEIRNRIERFEFDAGDEAKEWEERWAEPFIRCVTIDCVS
jgi:hypothetical protein